MKKLATILMLIAAILVGGAPLEAKTPRKGKTKSSHRSSSRTSAKQSELSLNTFLESFNEAGLNVNDWGITRNQASKVMVHKKDVIIGSTLEKMGFENIFTSVIRGWDYSVEDMVDCTHALYTKETDDGVLIVRENCGDFEIEFPSNDEKNKFLKTAEAKGYRYNSEFGNYIIPGTEDIYWIATFIYVNGNKVSFSAGGE